VGGDFEHDGTLSPCQSMLDLTTSTNRPKHSLLDLEFGMDGTENNDFEGEAEYEFVASNGQNDSNLDLETWIREDEIQNENNTNSDTNYSEKIVSNKIESAKDFRYVHIYI
jgi:hypothetical protein